METIIHINSVYDQELNPCTDLWDYITVWVVSQQSDEYVSKDKYQQGVIRCSLSNQSAVKHMDTKFAVCRHMRDLWYWVLDALRIRHDMLLHWRSHGEALGWWEQG
jgi:hypothetical protein